MKRLFLFLLICCASLFMHSDCQAELALSTPPQLSTTTYTVKKGDSLSVIAGRFRVSVKALLVTNRISSGKIFVGQRLVIPAAPNYSENRGVKAKSTVQDLSIGNFHLLCIGIDDYLHWPKLKTAVNDARAIEKVLREQYAFDQVHSLYNTDATERNIIKKLRALSKSLSADDSLFIFYAGHGHLDELTKAGSWIPVEASKDDASDRINNTDIKAIIRSMKCKHVLLVSDSCFAGDFFRGSRGKPPLITDEYVRTAFAKTSRQAITSGGLEPVSDAGFDNHSVFSHFLLKQLRENKEPYLLPSDLHNRIKNGVSANAKQQAILGILYDAGGEIGGEFVLFRKGIAGTLDEAVRKKKERIFCLEQLSEAERKKEEARQKILTDKEAEMNALDAKIANMQEALGNQDSGDDTLDQLFALAIQKEKQDEELEILRKKAKEERKKKEAEIAKLEADRNAKKKTAFEADNVKFLLVYNSPHLSKQARYTSWVAICKKWGIEQHLGGMPLYWDDKKQCATGSSLPKQKSKPINILWVEKRGCPKFEEDDPEHNQLVNLVKRLGNAQNVTNIQNVTESTMTNASILVLDTTFDTNACIAAKGFLKSGGSVLVLADYFVCTGAGEDYYSADFITRHLTQDYGVKITRLNDDEYEFGHYLLSSTVHPIAQTLDDLWRTHYRGEYIDISSATSVLNLKILGRPWLAAWDGAIIGEGRLLVIPDTSFYWNREGTRDYAKKEHWLLWENALKWLAYQEIEE